MTVLVCSVACSQSVVARKEFVGERNGLYTVRVSYKKGSGSAVSDVRIKDTLPEYLDLVSGQLSTTGPNVKQRIFFFFFFFFFFFLFVSDGVGSFFQPGKDFHNIDYVVRVVDYEFSLQNRTAEFNLPAATISFNKEDGSEGTIRTNALTLKVSPMLLVRSAFRTSLFSCRFLAP
jgi:hypothetical protein